MPPVLASIVEGHGEAAALRPLIENIIASSTGAVYPRIMRSHRMHRGSLVNNIDELEQFAALPWTEPALTAVCWFCWMPTTIALPNSARGCGGS